MSFGFEVYSDVVPNKVLTSSRDFLLSVLDVFEESPLNSSSRVYKDAAQFDLIIVQTQEEPAVVTREALLSLNTLQFSINTVGADKVVSWSPNIQFGVVRTVVVYVLGS